MSSQQDDQQENRMSAPVQRRTWRPPVVLIAAVAGVLLAFALLISDAIAGGTTAFDETILLAFHASENTSQPIGPLWFQEMVRDVTALGSTGVLSIVTLAVVAYLLIEGNRQTAWMVLAAVVGGVVFSSLLKIGIARPRPDLVPHSVEVYTNSFPSGHAMMSAVVYLTLGNLLAGYQTSPAMRAFLLTIAAFLTIIVGLSRIYLGVHWPSDVIAGWSLGTLWAALSWLVITRIQTPGSEQPAEKAANRSSDTAI